MYPGQAPPSETAHIQTAPSSVLPIRLTLSLGNVLGIAAALVLGNILTGILGGIAFALLR
jgi:hypothetical protein